MWWAIASCLSHSWRSTSDLAQRFIPTDLSRCYCSGLAPHSGRSVHPPVLLQARLRPRQGLWCGRFTLVGSECAWNHSKGRAHAARMQEVQWRFSSWGCRAEIPSYDHALNLRRLAMQSVTWSTSTVREEVRAQALRLGIDLAMDNALPKLRDIDTTEVHSACIPCLQGSGLRRHLNPAAELVISASHHSHRVYEHMPPQAYKS